MPLRKKKSSPPPQKNGRSWKNSNAPARWTGARRGFTARRCRGVWKRKMAGNNRKLRENQNGLGRIRLSDLRSETFCAYPLNKAGFGTVFALPERFEHILPRAKSAIKCSGKILAKALKRGCGFIFSRNASAAVECGKGKTLIIANSIIARFAIFAIYIRRTKKSEIFP